ncbi:glycoside hydrolase family 2 TIM barrel-domain containing protein [Hymenobacter sp. DG25B]|uniref:glycoside hydrolase family 2 TIM barrel-domain containing protein n=1 Tax=Hymenobacter sp. DG25B TaxID=1385664 RepID=UPI0005CB7DE6|nr:glycoside hydrolase family 2 TIM barrel-domain containing protein [Hymenobacter sp. DG25B]
MGFTFRVLAAVTLLGLISCNQNRGSENGLVSNPTNVVRLEQSGSGYRLTRNSKPFFIKGGAGLQHFDKLKAAGGNSIRIWTTEYADEVLNAAHQQGLVVMLGLWIKPAREGIDYYDPEALQTQQASIREQILRYRNHPALLMWNVGNEYDIEAPSPKVFQAVNAIAKMIHELDPNHPVTTTILANPNSVDHFINLCSDVDILSINVFAGLDYFPRLLDKHGLTKPYIVTEFGAKGHWEAPYTAWKAPLEQTSTAKAGFILPRYRASIATDTAHCLGGYVFFWGTKYEQTTTWFSLFGAKGEKTATVDLMQYLWTGKYPRNRAPEIGRLRFAGGYGTNNLQPQAGSLQDASVTASDIEGDSLHVVWQVFPDNNLLGRNKKKDIAPEEIPNSIIAAHGLHAMVRVPKKPGPYRLFVTIYDGKGSIATANAPFYSRIKSTD